VFLEATLKMILKMNFNFNFKDMPPAAGPSIHGVTNERDLHHTGKSGIKRVSWRPPECAGARTRIKSLSILGDGPGHPEF